MAGTSLDDAYALVTRLVVPRPIALVSTVSLSGQTNLAPFSYFMPGGSNPPSLAVCVSGSPSGGDKDTLANIIETRDFVVNLVDRPMLAGMNLASASLPPNESEWNLAGFESVPSVLVSPARVSISPVQFECSLYDVVRHGTGSGSSAYVIGEILAVHLRPDIAEGARIDPLARLGGREYLDLADGSRFEVARPKL